MIEGLPAGCRTNQEEIFGPVATLIPFDTEEEALDGANGTPYGLAAILWTEHLGEAPPDPRTFAALWRGEARDAYGEATVIGTAALALLAAGAAPDLAAAQSRAQDLWSER